MGTQKQTPNIENKQTVLIRSYIHTNINHETRRNSNIKTNTHTYTHTHTHTYTWHTQNKAQEVFVMFVAEFKFKKNIPNVELISILTIILDT